ncbi:MAG: rhodanese-like domain-containing protein [Anaerolineales bacterium]|nr:rhodanese-like domain-containing protein [Anaerolineales bacterium]
MTNKPRQSLQRENLRVYTLAILVIVLILSGCSTAAGVGAPEPLSERISAAEYNQRFGTGVDHLLIDVRTADEFVTGHIPGAINISVQSLPDRLNEIPTDKPLVVYCRSGNRSATATSILIDAGFSLVYDLGGIQDWVSAGNPIDY